MGYDKYIGVSRATAKNTSATRSYGRLYAAAKRRGRSSRGRLADLLIAATAAANDLPIYTRNPEDFRGMEGIIQIVGVDADPETIERR